MYPENPRRGVATSIALSPAAELVLGGTLQLSATLSDAAGNAVSPTQPFVFHSSNVALATVDQNGFVTAANGDPTQLQTGGSVAITVSYPWGGVSSIGGTISATARLIITVPAAPSTTILQTFERVPGLVQFVEFRGRKNIPVSGS